MLATPHALIGAVIASKIHNPAIGLPVAFFSHFLFDLVPHWDWGWHPGEHCSRITDPTKRTRIFWESFVDVFVGFLLSYLLFGNSVNHVYLFAMIIAAQGPDWLSTPYYLFGWHIWPLKIVCDIQHKMQLHARLPWGILNQALAVGGMAVLLLR